MTQNLLDQKGKKLLGKGWVKPDILRDVAKPFDLLGFSLWVGSWESV
jgi:hypothetical protein